MPAKLLAVALSGVLAASAAGPEGGVIYSTGTADKKPLAVELGLQSPKSRNGAPTVGVGVGLDEGKPLEMLLWGSGGAIAGSFAGPLGAAVGGAAGMLVGLAVAVFIVPHNGPEEKVLPSHPEN